MENSIDGETDCEKCPTGRCLLLDKRDTQTIVPDAGDDGNEGDDEDDDDDNDTNNHEDDEKVSDDENRQNLINPNDAIFCQQSQNVNNGSIQNIEHHSGNQNNLTNSNRAHKNNVNTSFSNLEQQGDNNSLDQVKSSESHNHSINGVNDLAVKSKRFSRISQDKRLKKSEIDEPTDNGKLNQASFKFDGASYPNGVLTTSNNNKINNFLTSNLTNNKITCVCNGKSDNAKCIRRLISSDSGGSNKSSSKSGRRSRSGGPPQSPPDGGWGWVVVFASFMISLIADGVSLSYGFFQMDLSDHFGESKGKTALVGSLLLSMPALTGPIASALTDRYGCRSMTIVSGLLSASGFILGSFARKLEHLFIAFSITGIGLSLSYVTSIVIVAYYFNTKRSLATGLAVCGTGIGTFLFAPLTTYLLKEYSWRGTLLIMSGFFLNIIVFGALMKDINVSEFDSIDSQESDSDEDSVIESMNGHNSTLLQHNCCGAFVLGPCNGGKSDFNAGHNGAKGVICNESSIDINKNDFPLVPLSSTRKTANVEATCHCVGKLPHQLNSSSSKLNGSPNKPLSSNCINSHCSSMFPIDKQVTTTFFQNQPDHLHARNNHNLNHHNHQHQCNQVNHRLLRFQSSYSSSNPKSDLKNYSSLVNIPTYITTDDLISKDILDEISGRKDGNLNQLLQKYPNLLTIHNNREQEKSLFCSSRVIGRDQVQDREVSIPINDSRDVKLGVNGLPINSPIVKGNYGLDSKRRLKGDFEPVINRSTANRPKFVGGNNIGMAGTTGLGKEGLGLRMQRASLTYRTAVFRDVRRYRLRSSSAPDIFHNSMVTISERENFLCDIKQVLVDSVDLSIFKNIRFTIFCLSNLLLHGCIDVPYVYLPDHAISSGICVKEMATYLISVLGIANTLGTIIVGYIGDKPWLSPSTWYSGLTALGGISMALIPFVRNYYLLAVLAAFYGFSVSANYTLVSVILVDLISLDKFTNAYGLMLLVQGIASMLGPPIAGWLFDISGDYDTTFYVIGLCVFASGTIVFPLKESPSTSSPSASSSPSNGSSVIESTSRTSSPTEDKIAALSSNKTLFGKEPFP